MNKSTYRKNKDNRKVLYTYIVCVLLISFLFFFAGKVQQNCIEANNVTLCD